MTWKNLHEQEILDLLEDGNISDIGSIDNDEEIFPINEFDELMDIFDNDEENTSNEVPENLEISNSLVQYHVTNKKDIKWVQQPFENLKLNLDDIESVIAPASMPAPIDYFNKYFSNDFYEQIAYNTLLYTVQKGIHFSPTNAQEIKCFIAIHIIMGTLKFPRVRMYWEEAYRINTVANNMTRDRFFQLRSNFHIIDNVSIPPNNKDKFIKVRPLYNLIKKQCNSLIKERNLSIDEQMVPFKGNLSIKQYIKGKPCPWGIKIFVLAGSNGMVYDFILYQGSNTEINQDLQKIFGIGGSIVLQLAEGIKKNSHYLYFDNFFSSYQLFERL
ncbi:PREDICTED: piggyBac transposable element-derived protein 3-like [Diuraphis noxia]|uniref:piggyBac transposable element-derived protein 3-like n=1 Tax=Diuraphis noxia TaxID=143948 RepID=UPI00076375A9|nr:PREDICTED: piggyBac transposable element-derived protein 3-like [Diuraphis noxia]